VPIKHIIANTSNDVMNELKAAKIAGDKKCWIVEEAAAK